MRRFQGAAVASALSIAALALASLFAASLAAAAPSGAAKPSRVLVTRSLGEDNLYYRPHRFFLSGDGTFGMAGVKWQSYGGKTATATATAYANDCEPFCAAGHFYRPKAKIRLTKIVECSGQPLYARLSYTLLGSVPQNFPRTGTFSMVPRTEDGTFEC